MSIQPDGTVHPVADLFPMMSDEELDDLAADIAANGLLHPIVLDAEGQLIDGRNRLAACQRAGVEPTFTTLDGHEPVAFILSSNMGRRHMTQGQKALALAHLYKLYSQSDLARTYGVPQPRIAQASMIVRYAPELIQSVMSGAMGLEAACEQARVRKAAADSDEERNRLYLARLEELHRTSPDLADLVVEERMTLDEAIAASREREKQRRQESELATRALVEMVQAANAGIASEPLRERAIALYQHEVALQRGYPLSKTVILSAAANMRALAEGWDDEGA